MIPIAAEHMRAIERGSRYAAQCGDSETAATLSLLYSLWSTIVQVRGGTTETGWSQEARPRRAEPLSPGRLAAAEPTAPFICQDIDESGGVRDWKAPCS